MVASRADYATTKRIDIAVYQGEQLQLVVEVKGKSGATREWAARMRRNLVAHLDIPNSPYFLLALPDHFYLWCSDPSPSAVVPPDYDIDPAPLLAPYVDNDRPAPRVISEYGLTLAVSSWLTDLAATQDADKAGLTQAWLFDSGLYRAITGGVVQPQAAL